MTDAEIIQLERQIAEDTEVTQIRLNSQYCPTCGTRKILGVCEYCGPVIDFSMNDIEEIPY